MVLELPKHESRWMTVTAEELVLKRRPYWLSLQQEHDELLGQKTVTVCVSEHNLLDVKALRKLMKRSRGGEV